MDNLVGFFEEVKPLMKKYGIKSVTPLSSESYIGFKDDGMFYVSNNFVKGLTGQLKEKVMCEHNNKVFANYSYASNPPKTPWICKDCGYEGVQQGTGFADNYQLIKRKFNNK